MGIAHGRNSKNPGNLGLEELLVYARPAEDMLCDAWVIQGVDCFVEYPPAQVLWLGFASLSDDVNYSLEKVWDLFAHSLHMVLDVGISV